MEKNWEKIYASAQQHQVSIVKALLDENDIKSVEINKKDSSYAFGEIELYVDRENIIKAKYIITKNNL